MNLKEMKYVDAIARAGSLSAAGKLLGVSQPSLSCFLSRLEAQLGTELFRREKKQMIPTPAGKIYIHAAQKILQVQEQTLQSIARLTHRHTATICIGATPLRGAVMFASIFPSFSRRYPDIRLEIREGYMEQLRQMAQTGSVSFSLGSCWDSENPGLDTLILSKEEIVLGVPAFHPLSALAAPPGSRPTAVSIRQFADSPFVLLSKGTTLRAISDRLFAREGVSPTVVFETNNNLVLGNMVLQGAGVGLLPLSSAIQASNDVVYFSLKPRYYLSLCIFTAKNRELSEAERYLIYLTIHRDKNNPLYLFSPDPRARAIYEEFCPREEELK